MDTLISEYNQDFNQRSFWYNPEFGPAVYESAVLDGDGVARQLQASNLLTLPFGTFNEELQDLNSTALHIEWLAGDWTLNAEASYAEAEEQNTTIFVTGIGFVLILLMMSTLMLAGHFRSVNQRARPMTR